MAFSRIRETFELVILAIQIRYRRLVELIQTVRHYYHNRLFRRIDVSLFFLYLLDNPYTAARRFAVRQGEENIHTYGETPLTTLEEIVKRCEITSKDTVYELGSGRGRSCFWLHCFVGCNVVGVEYNPHFYRKAEALRARYNVSDLAFVCEDLLKVNYSKATVVYLYGTCLEDEFIVKLVDKLKELPKGARVISISYPLTEYVAHSRLKLLDFFDATFTWGEATVYLHSVS